MKKALGFVTRAVIVGLLIVVPIYLAVLLLAGERGSNLYPRLFQGAKRSDLRIAIRCIPPFAYF
jgi:hypothetical protein